MSRATKRKHVLNEALQDYFTPPSDDQEIVRILASRGNNLHEVESSLTDDTYLVSMPTKFRKNIWVKRGDFVIVEPIKEGSKVRAEMVRVLAKEHIKYFKKINIWPAQFDKKFEQDSDEDLLDKVDSLTCSDDTESSTTSDDDGDEETTSDDDEDEEEEEDDDDDDDDDMTSSEN